MAYLRTLKILEQIHMLFEESDFELRTNKKLRKQNRDKLQIGLNLNGTVTVVAPCRKDTAVFITFDGTRTAEIWSGGSGVDVFWIEEEGYTPEEIRGRFRKILEEDYGFEFKNGGHQLIHSDMKFTLLPTARIITQFFKVFHSSDLNLKMSYRDPNTGCQTSGKRFVGGINANGNIVIRAYIEMLREEMSPTKSIHIIFDGSDEVTIINEYRTDSSSVAVDDARRVLVEECGVSFANEWQEPIGVNVNEKVSRALMNF